MNEENEGMLLYMDNDGTFREYDQRNDIVIHCDSEEDKEWLMKKLESGDDAKDTNVLSKWIPISERLPKEEEYILLSFANYTGLDIGRYEHDGENDKFYPGDDDETYAQYGLIVNA
jgi:hypothetical protein